MSRKLAGGLCPSRLMGGVIMRIYGDDWTERYRRKLVRRGDLCKGEDGSYYLTPQGEERVLREIGQYWRRPAVLVLIEQWFAEQFGVNGKES